MAGLCIKGGTGLCSLVLDKDLLENSEYTTDIGQLYNKTYETIEPTVEIEQVITKLDAYCQTPQYPFNVAAAFGYGRI